MVIKKVSLVSRIVDIFARPHSSVRGGKRKVRKARYFVQNTTARSVASKEGWIFLKEMCDDIANEWRRVLKR
jgi:hypothetical protein